MTARDHNKLLSTLFFILGGLQALIGVFMAFVYGGMGTMLLATGRRDEEQMMGGIFLVLSVVVGLVIVAIAGFFLLTGWSVLKQKPSGRTLGIIASCLSLLSFPLGTALGVYGLWFFFGDAGKNFYSGLQSGSSSPRPPAPGNWQ
jgi:hypothetical protein